MSQPAAVSHAPHEYVRRILIPHSFFSPCVPGLREGHMHPNRAPIPGAHFKSHVYAACADGAGLGKEAGGERAALQYATRRQAGRQLDGCEGCAAAPHHPHADATWVLRAHATHPHEPHGRPAPRGAASEQHTPNTLR